MKKTIKSLSLIACILIMVSCEKEIEFNGELLAPMIVVNSFASPDSAIYAQLTKSKFFLSNKQGFDYVDNANVNVYINHKFTEQLTYTTNGLYIGTLKPQVGDTIQIKVNVTGYPLIESSSIIQPPANILAVDTTVVKTENSYFSGESTYFNIKIKDPAEVKNYYRLTVKMRNERMDGDILRVYEYLSTFSLEGVDNQSGNLIDLIQNTVSSSDQYLITDDLFNGREFNFKITTGFFHNSSSDDNSNKDNIVINLQTISRDMYLYLKSKESTEKVLNGFFTEPVQIYNNITNGIGIFGTFTNNEYKFKL